jgi:hypothetical protein
MFTGGGVMDAECCQGGLKGQIPTQFGVWSDSERIYLGPDLGGRDLDWVGR